MAILLYLKGQKDSLMLKESASGFEKAINQAYQDPKTGVTTFEGWHGQPIWVNQLLMSMEYAVEEDDKEIQKQIDERKAMMKEQEETRKRALRQQGLGKTMPSLTIPGMRAR